MYIQMHACYLLPSVSLHLLHHLVAIYLLYSQHLKNWPQTPIAPGLLHPLVFPCTKGNSIFLLPQSFREDSSPAFFNCLRWIKDVVYKTCIFYTQLRTNNIYLSTALLWGRKLSIPSTFNLGIKNSLSIVEPRGQGCSQCHSTKSGPARGNAYDPSGLDPAAVKPGLLFFFFLPLLQSEFLPFFSNVMIITEHPANGSVILIFPLAGEGEVNPLYSKAGMSLRAWSFFLGTEELVTLWKHSLLRYPPMSSKRNSFKLSFSHQ